MNWIEAKDLGGRDCWTVEVCKSCHQVKRDLHAVAGVAGIGKVGVAWTRWFYQT